MEKRKELLSIILQAKISDNQKIKFIDAIYKINSEVELDKIIEQIANMFDGLANEYEKAEKILEKYLLSVDKLESDFTESNVSANKTS